METEGARSQPDRDKPANSRFVDASNDMVVDDQILSDLRTFSEPARTEVRHVVLAYARDLVRSAINVKKSMGGDSVSSANVKEALLNLSRQESRRSWTKLAGVFGGILLGTGFSALASIILQSDRFTSAAVSFALVTGALGAFLIALDLAQQGREMRRLRERFRSGIFLVTAHKSSLDIDLASLLIRIAPPAFEKVSGQEGALGVSGLSDATAVSRMATLLEWSQSASHEIAHVAKELYREEGREVQAVTDVLREGLRRNREARDGLSTSPQGVHVNRDDLDANTSSQLEREFSAQAEAAYERVIHSLEQAIRVLEHGKRLPTMGPFAQMAGPVLGGLLFVGLVIPGPVGMAVGAALGLVAVVLHRRETSKTRTAFTWN